jgi:3-phenylpropionate/cinnamic acid dioxygenase small subunit
VDDVTAIANLISRYAELIDAGDFEAVADLLADAEVTAEGSSHVTRGRDEVLALYTSTTRRYEDGTPRTRHLTTNLITEVEDDSATVRSYFTVLQAVSDALTLQPIIAGRYRDRFVRSGGGWRFAARHITVDLVGDVSHHLLIDLPTAPT